MPSVKRNRKGIMVEADQELLMKGLKIKKKILKRKGRISPKNNLKKTASSIA